MNKLFHKIGKLIEKSPFKVLLTSLVIMVILITGGLKVNMATGNETLVKTDSEAYMSNYEMEEEFGGDAVIVLLKGNKKDLLSQENIEKIWHVEERLQYNEDIFSFLSPVTIVHQMTDKQGQKIKENLPEISDGLEEMSEKLIEIGKELGDKDVPDPKEIEAKLDDLMANMDPGRLMASGFVTMGENLWNLSEVLESFHEKSGMMAPSVPHNQEELDFILYDDHGKLKDIFSDTIIDDEHLMMIIKLQGNIEDSAKDQVYKEVVQAMEAEDFGEVEYLISGKPVLDSSLKKEMKANMQNMVMLATIVMTLVLLLVFKVRWRTLSIGVILISVIGTLGLMGHLSVSMTMVSMAVFPILIGLGIDFSIQFHNRYEEEIAVTKSLTQTGKAVALAVFASMLGFISLYASPVPMIQDFGKMLTIGVVVSFLGSVFLLMPILKIRDLYNPACGKAKLGGSPSPEQEEGGLLGRILGRTAKFVSRFAPIVLIVATVLAGLGLFADSKVGVQTDIETFMPQDMDALEDIKYVRDVVGSTDQMVIYMDDEKILSENNISWMQDKVNFIEAKYSLEVEDVKSIDNLVKNISDDDNLNYEEYMDLLADLPESQRSMFINEERTKGAIIINIKHMSTEKLNAFVEDLRNDLDDAPMKVRVTGKSVLDVEMVEGLTAGRVKMTMLGIALVFLGLLLVYRNIFKALIPVIPVILIVGMSGGIMYLLGLSYTPITATLGALILGMGTETTLMILERYVEERESGKNKAHALDLTVRRIGKATLSTELTTMGGFAVLMFSDFVILKDFGLMTVINVSLILISTFVVLPAVIWLLDDFIIKE